MLVASCNDNVRARAIPHNFDRNMDGIMTLKQAREKKKTTKVEMTRKKRKEKRGINETQRQGEGLCNTYHHYINKHILEYKQ